MKKLIIIIIILLLSSIMSFAELSNEAKSNIETLRERYINEEIESIEELIERLKSKQYALFAIDTDDRIFYDGITINIPIVEVVDIPINVLMQLKGWEIWINDKRYYVLLVEKED